MFGSFSVIFLKGDNFCAFLFAFLHPMSRLKNGSTVKGNVFFFFFLHGEKLLLFRIDPS